MKVATVTLVIAGIVITEAACDQSTPYAGNACSVNVPKPHIDHDAIVFTAASICRVTPASATLEVRLYYAKYHYPKTYYLDDEDAINAIPTADLATTPANVKVGMICTAGERYFVVVTASATYPPEADAVSDSVEDEE